MRSCLPRGAPVREAIAASLPLRRQPLSACSAPAIWARSEELPLASGPGLPQSAGRFSSPSGYGLCSRSCPGGDEGCGCLYRTAAGVASSPVPRRGETAGLSVLPPPRRLRPLLLSPDRDSAAWSAASTSGALGSGGHPWDFPTDRAGRVRVLPTSLLFALFFNFFFLVFAARLTVSSDRYHCPRHNVHVWTNDVFLLGKEVIG